MSEYWDDPYGLDADDTDDAYASEVLDESYYSDQELAQILGVAGPGDGWTSSGPGGMTSLEAQKAAQPSPAAAAEEPGFFDSLFGSDEEVLVAEEGAAAAAADQVIDNVFDGQGGIQWGEEVSQKKPGGGSSSSSSTTAPVDIEGDASSFAPSKSTTAILLGVAAGVLLFMVKK